MVYLKDVMAGGVHDVPEGCDGWRSVLRFLLVDEPRQYLESRRCSFRKSYISYNFFSKKIKLYFILRRFCGSINIRSAHFFVVLKVELVQPREDICQLSSLVEYFQPNKHPKSVKF